MDSRILVVDTIWCRLLSTLERLEIVEGFQLERTTECHDVKAGTPPTKDEKAELFSEFEFQKKAFFVGAKPIAEHMDRYKIDFSGWCAGRIGNDSSEIDDLCRLLGRELLGIGGFELKLPSGELSMDRAEAPQTQGGSIGLKSEDEDHSHARGEIDDGVKYLAGLDERFSVFSGGEPASDENSERTDR